MSQNQTPSDRDIKRQHQEAENRAGRAKAHPNRSVPYANQLGYVTSLTLGAFDKPGAGPCGETLRYFYAHDDESGEGLHQSGDARIAVAERDVVDVADRR